MKKGIGPLGLGSPNKMLKKGAPGSMALLGKKKKRKATMSDADKARKERLAAVRENSKAMKEERALIAKRKRNSKLGLSMEEIAVTDRLQKEGRTKDIKKT